MSAFKNLLTNIMTGTLSYGKGLKDAVNQRNVLGSFFRTHVIPYEKIGMGAIAIVGVVGIVSSVIDITNSGMRPNRGNSFNRGDRRPQDCNSQVQRRQVRRPGSRPGSGQIRIIGPTRDRA